MFDTSNFPADHPSGIKSGVNKKVVGMFKDEYGGNIMHEFVGLRAKLYSYRMYEGNEPLARLKEEKRCKRWPMDTGAWGYVKFKSESRIFTLITISAATEIKQRRLCILNR
ncbi:hypothetical protein MAR_021024 [Mya arenaria]|uniref:Uncharacterized protein n=1 Tax=Mya arenaria TaxID=6604 RepID=A0ABY7E716_MYAAR|nr:hypothetical protein MAR_021024 [Mya arenaria]